MKGKQNSQANHNIVPVFRKAKKSGILLEPEYASAATDMKKGLRTKGHPGTYWLTHWLL